MGAFLWPPCTAAQALLILAALAWLSLREPRPAEDLCLFLGGSLLGVPIEFWGTRHPCWTYYTHQTPAVVAIFAHGFCAVAFSRGVQFFAAARKRLALPALVPYNSGA